MQPLFQRPVMGQKKKIDMRRACMAIAVKRVVEAFELRGIWP